MRDWQSIRRGFVEEGRTLRELSREHAIPYSTLWEHARRELWRERREEIQREENAAHLARVVKRLLERLEEALREGESLEARDLKAVTGALKELSEILGEQEHTAPAPEPLTVRFVGETEEMSL